MNRITKIILVFKVLAVQLIPGYLAAQGELIPRSVFFEGESRTAFQCDPEGNFLYFLSNKAPRHLIRRSVGDLAKEDSVAFSAPIQTLNVSGTYPLVLWEGGQRLSILKEEGPVAISLPGPRQRVRLLRSGAGATRDLFALRIEAEQDSIAGIYILSLSTGQLVKKYPLDDMSNVFLDGGLNLRAAYRGNTEGGTNFYYYQDETEKWEVFWRNPWSMDNLVGSFSQILGVGEDPHTIWFTSNKNSDKCRLYTWNTQSHSVQEVCRDSLVDLLPYGSSIDTRGNLTSVLGMFADSRRHVLNERDRKDFYILDSLCGGNFGFIHSLDEDRKWLIRDLHGAPGRILLYDRYLQRLKLLAWSHPDLAAYPLASRKAFGVKAFDGLQLPIHVYLPPGSDPDGDGIPNEPLPSVVYVHGGPWVGVFHWNGSFHWRNFQLLANRGYAVINVEFRGGTGLGKDFYERSQKKWGTDMNRDLESIARFVIDKGISREGKMGIWGWSYGGYASFASLTFSPELFDCGISMYGISDLDSFGRIPFANNDFWHRWVGDPFDKSDQRMLQKVSPLNHIMKIQSPLLLTTGSQDARVPQEQMDRMADALARAKKNPIYFYYPEEGHDYQNPGSWISFWAVAEKFLENHLGGRYLAQPSDLERGKYKIVYGAEIWEEIRSQKPSKISEK